MKPKRRHVVISGAGDRRDEDIRDLTRILGNAFDNVILYQDACQRGREDGEVLKLLQGGLVDATKAKLILIDQVEESLAYPKEKVQP